MAEHGPRSDSPRSLLRPVHRHEVGSPDRGEEGRRQAHKRKHCGHSGPREELDQLQDTKVFLPRETDAQHCACNDESEQQGTDHHDVGEDRLLGIEDGRRVSPSVPQLLVALELLCNLIQPQIVSCVPHGVR
eukprot:CAMPEP_0171070234 /NCGR_PEP_ID=MMETSP0766_2-20121228/9618_1 /TAXON_ID=439317 /ORGANISM="Gambierdiscus australes, Strain CAWD 149" /LENGTH=131 /DNA_ID=CAMNT_0011526683 /DNA_START=928 /DNA_END=1323 /DNA_ORIENTATION=-